MQVIVRILALFFFVAQAHSVDITVPEGFKATVFHPGAGATRHITVRDNGDVYVARRYLQNVPMFGQKASYGAILAMRDIDGDGEADITKAFGPTEVGTGIGIYKDHLYFSSDVAIFRIPLDDQLVPFGVAEPIAGGFPMNFSHGNKTFTFDNEGYVYVNSGVPSNNCMEKKNRRESPGLDPCPQLAAAGGIWRFKADKKYQDQMRDGERYVTGIRNVMALDWNQSVNKLYFVMHGRDSMGMMWPKKFDREDNRDLPAEEFHQAQLGDDFGWPYSYWDPIKGARFVAPEYGGDGERKPEAGKYRDPLFGFPAHWAPNDLIFHSGNNLPEKYAGGAFVIFHGSWNRMPFEQEGFKVVFVPMNDGLPVATKDGNKWEVFADGFIGKDSIKSPADTAYRPTGLAEGPDGSIYITEDKTGRIWKVSYPE